MNLLDFLNDTNTIIPQNGAGQFSASFPSYLADNTQQNSQIPQNGFRFGQQPEQSQQAQQPERANQEPGWLYKLFNATPNPQGQEQGWLQNLTGIANSNNQGQRQALSLGLAQAAGAIANANRPGQGYTPGLGQILGAGVGGFGQGIQASSHQQQVNEMMRTKILTNQVKQQQAQQRMEQGQTRLDAPRKWSEGRSPEDRLALEANPNIYSKNLAVNTTARDKYQLVPTTDAYGNQGYKVFNPSTGQFANGGDINSRPAAPAPTSTSMPTPTPMPTPQPDGQDVPIKDPDAKAQEAAKKEAEYNAIRQESASRVLGDIDRALAKVQDYSIFPNTGFIGSGLRMIPGTDAHYLGNILEGIGANISLQVMRELSPNGIVSDKDFTSLQSIYGSLNPSQSAEQLIQNLRRLKEVYTKIAFGSGTQTTSGVNARGDNRRPLSYFGR